MLIISPVDLLLLQDMELKTNWLASFSRFVEARQGPQGNPHWALPWMFCLHHMVAEGIVPEGDGGVIQQMCQHINHMRDFMYTRVESDENYGAPTFRDWVRDGSHLADRFAEFCWFLALTAGNYRMDVAGAWFPYCAKCSDTHNTLNATYGMAVSAEESAQLEARYKNVTLAQARAAQEHARGAVGPLRRMLALVPEPPVAALRAVQEPAAGPRRCTR